MNSGAPGSRIALTDEQLQEVEKFASIGFSPRKIAVALGIPGNLAHIFVTEAEQEGTPVNQHFLKGVYKTEAEARLNIASSAKSSIFAYQEMKKSLLESEVDELKRKLEPTAEVTHQPTFELSCQYRETLDDYYALKQYYEEGSGDSLPANLKQYWDRLSMAHDLITNIADRAKGRKYVVNVLKSKYPGISDATAYRLINESINFFNTTLDRSHWKNFLCETLDKVIAVAWKMNRMDWIIKAVGEQAKIQGLHNPEQEPIPEELLAQKVIVISNNARDFGYEPISKSDLLARINQYEVDNLHKKRLARDAGITDIDFEQ